MPLPPTGARPTTRSSGRRLQELRYDSSYAVPEASRKMTHLILTEAGLRLAVADERKQRGEPVQAAQPRAAPIEL